MIRQEGGENADGKITLTRDELKDEIRKELRHESRRRFFFSLALYLIFFFIMLGLPFLLIAVIAAQSGLYHVPVLSSWLYHPPAPVRIVVPLAGAGPDAIITSVTAKATYDQATGVAELTFSEQELTTLFAASVEEADASGTLPFPLESMQVALLDGNIMEFYAVTEREGYEAPVILSVTPQVTAGRLEMDTVDFHIGSFDVPDFMSDLVLDAFAANAMSGLEEGFAGVGALDDIGAEEGKLRVDIRPRL